MTPEKKLLCIRILCSNPFFQNLDSDELDKLLAYTRTKQFKKNETIFSKGQEGGQLYAVISGTVKINSLSLEGKEITLRLLEQGSFFGEMALFENAFRSASAIMHSTGELLIIEQKEFKHFIEQTPKIAYKMIVALCNRLRDTTELLEDTLFLNLPVRLAKRLLRMSELHGKQNAQGLLIDFKVSQTELGNFVHSSRESVNKLLREWKQTGIIEFNNGYITIIDIEALEEITEDFTNN